MRPGQRVAAFCMLGGFAEVAVAPPFLTFPLPDALDFAQGAALILNYHTAYFALALRGRLREGETVLVHGAAGGVGTAVLQVAAGLGARTIAVVSSDGEGAGRARGGRRGGAALPTAPGGMKRRSSRAAAWTSCSTPSAASASPTACARCAPDGRLVVVGFTGGVDPRGAGQPAAARQRRGGRRRLGRLRARPARALSRDRRADRAS